jgi:aminomuconate-semialdehyde/2-hydroxymuconate-6-semialdehyde dehydrogenase
MTADPLGGPAPLPAAPAGPVAIRNFVAGEWADGIATFADISPVDGTVVGLVQEAGVDLVDRAVRAARAALDGLWGRSSVTERVAALRRIADRIADRFSDLLAAEVADTGKPHAQARGLDVRRAIANFRIFSDVLAARGTAAFLTDTPDGGRALNYVMDKPLGVVAVIVPWNLPLLLLTWKLAPALACGNTVVIKPSEETPWSATVLAEVIAEAGLPDGVVNLVHGFGPASAGEYLTTHPGVDAVTFTGESGTGAAIMAAVAPSVKPVSFELGGKNAAVVFSDADLDAAVAGVARSSFANTGQVCLCTERVYVHRPIADEFVAGLIAAAHSLRLGDPADPATTTGPLISRQHREKVLSYYDIANRDGQVLTGGAVPDLGTRLAGGAWIEPTVVTGVGQKSRLMQEEVFGPICAVTPFDTEDEAIALANDTRYGLAAVTWTTDLNRAHRVAAAMQVGISWVNTWFLRDLRSPFGGRGFSGIGREGGEYSLHFYTDPTNVCIAL